ncbi:MAG TPA: 1-acyl-sn-glycerol-3-phosphate acyltransferase, partial [Planctomycetota bacterium]|nr:1-acyl-sn-glycerol-3-phosphate acyltransferase [Planctomycetota bacterium]
MSADASGESAAGAAAARSVGARPCGGMKILPWFWELVFHGALLLMRLRLKTEWRGLEKAPSGAVVLAAKHGSSWDIPLMSRLARRALGRRAYFQMGSFIGYPVLGPLVPLLRRCGGFCVMRPKEILRLRRRGSSRDALHALMDRVNREATETRRAVLETGGVLVFFPEGSRDATQVLPLKADREITTAVDLRFEGVASTLWPIVLSYGSKRRWRRRRVIVEALDPF